MPFFDIFMMNSSGFTRQSGRSENLVFYATPEAAPDWANAPPFFSIFLGKKHSPPLGCWVAGWAVGGWVGWVGLVGLAGLAGWLGWLAGLAGLAGHGN